MGLATLTDSLPVASVPAANPSGLLLPRRREAKGVGHDAEYIRVVHRTADPLAARPGCRQDHVFSRMHAGAHHGRQIAQTQRDARNILVFFNWP